METSVNLWSVPVDVPNIPEAGLHLEIEAPEPVRAGLAVRANLREIVRIHAAFDLTRHGAGVHVVGQLNARVGQTCVVSLEPMESDVEESIDLLFMPRLGESEPAVQTASGEAELPEPLVDNKVDLAAIAAEFLFLGLNPYPRKPGAEFTAPTAEKAVNHPFAGLEVLKKRLGHG
jgi:uncharacterized metal-binding protein YceD (DUF177 family)